MEFFDLIGSLVVIVLVLVFAAFAFVALFRLAIFLVVLVVVVWALQLVGNGHPAGLLVLIPVGAIAWTMASVGGDAKS